MGNDLLKRPVRVSWGELRQKHFPAHQHQGNEIVVVVRGRAIHVVEQCEFPIETGDVFVVKGEQTHGYRDLDFDIYNIQYLPSHYERRFEILRHLPGYNALFVVGPSMPKQGVFSGRCHLAGSEFARLVDLIREMKREQEEAPPGNWLMLDSLFTRLVVTLCRSYIRREAGDDPSYLMGEVVSYMESHFASEITLGELAARANMSKNTFLRVFKQVFGKSPIFHLVNLRVRKAGLLLRDTDKRISDIALETGFRDSNYFTRQFKKHVDLSPREYRHFSRKRD